MVLTPPPPPKVHRNRLQAPLKFIEFEKKGFFFMSNPCDLLPVPSNQYNLTCPKVNNK